jgi:hypothetical protein
MKTKNIKTALGIVLVLLAIAALLFWEAEGRELLLMNKVLVAGEDVKEGEIFEMSKFRIESIPAGALVDEAITPEKAAMFSGKESSVLIIKGAQLSKRYFRDPDTAPKPDTSFFVIRNEWIYMCTSSLRRGDEVLITSADGRNIMGQFSVAYVKDSEGREVIDSQSGIYSFAGSAAGSERVNTSAPIHHVEIECELKDYKKILDYCAGKIGAPLMLVRETGND